MATTATAAAATSAATIAAIAVATTTAVSQGCALCDLLCAGLTHLDHLAAEMQGLACQRVVEVHHDHILLHLQYGAVHAMPLGVHHRDGVALLDHLCIKLAIHLEDALRQIQHVLLHQVHHSAVIDLVCQLGTPVAVRVVFVVEVGVAGLEIVGIHDLHHRAVQLNG